MRILSSVLLLLGFVIISVHSETCPAPEEIYPCKCEESKDNIVISCERTTLQQLKPVLNYLHSKSNVEFNFLSINFGRLPWNIFEDIDVKGLTFNSCTLDSLTDKDDRPAFSGLENKLEELRIVACFTEDNVMPKLKLKHMRNLQILAVSFNTIGELGNDWFDEVPTTLEFITMNENKVDKIGDRVFANLINLQSVTFENNVCGDTLKRSMLPNPAKELRFLGVTKNCLTKIPEDGFEGMPNLFMLSLSNNKITRLEQHQWQDIWENLYEIHLEGNPLECDSHMDWILSLTTTKYIYGTCAGPSERRGMTLKNFLKRNY